MRRLFITLPLAFLFVMLMATAAYAHDILLSGQVACRTDEHRIQWRIENDWGTPLTIASATATQGPTTYPVTGYANPVPSNGVTSALTLVPGATTGSVTLTVSGTWASDGQMRTRSTTVALGDPCVASTTTTSTSTTSSSTTTSTSTSTSTSSSTTTSQPGGSTTSTSAVVSGSTSSTTAAGTTSTSVGIQGATASTSTTRPTATATGTGAAPTSTGLPFTGANTAVLTLLGVAVVALGAAVAYWRRPSLSDD